MAKIFSALIGLLLVACTATSPVVTSDNQYGFAEIRAVVYPLRVKSIEGGPVSPSQYGNGSAVLIGDKTFLTSAHIFERPAQYFIQIGPNPDKDLIPLKLIKIDRQVDLALVSADVHCPCISVAPHVPSIDAEVVTVGYPYMRYINMQIATEGRVQGLDSDRDMLTTASIVPGNSGGGVFTKINGKWYLSGIVKSVFGMSYDHSRVNPRLEDVTVFTTWLAFCVSSELIVKFLENKNSTGFELPQTPKISLPKSLPN